MAPLVRTAIRLCAGWRNWDDGGDVVFQAALQELELLMPLSSSGEPLEVALRELLHGLGPDDDPSGAPADLYVDRIRAALASDPVDVASEADGVRKLRRELEAAARALGTLVAHEELHPEIRMMVHATTMELAMLAEAVT